MCRHAAYYEQIGADLEVVKWVRNGYELKLKVAARQRHQEPHFVWHELRKCN